MAKNKFKVLLLGLILSNVFLSGINLAYAADQLPTYSGVQGSIEKYLCAPTDASKSGGNAASGDLYKCINQLYKFAIIFASVVGVFFIVIGGYIYMSAEGNSESVDKAKSILTSSIVALVILFGGYILLKGINPDLIQFRSIQPPSVTLQPVGTPVTPPETGGTTGPAVYTGTPSNHTFSELAGCSPQTPTQALPTEIGRLTEAMFQKLKSVCTTLKQKNLTAQVSGIIGLNQHSTNSLHYRGCAVDFAGGQNQQYTSQEPGLTIIAAANSLGLRNNPGVDGSRTDMVHIDLDTSCPSPGQPTR